MDTAKTYVGDRTIDGIVVTVNGEPLPERTDIHEFTDLGYEWTYEGESPQQLSLAILADFLGDADKALKLSGPFMSAIVANLDNTWELSGQDVADAVAALDG